MLGSIIHFSYSGKRPGGSRLRRLALKAHQLPNAKTARKGQETEGGWKLAILNHTDTQEQLHSHPLVPENVAHKQMYINNFIWRLSVAHLQKKRMSDVLLLGLSLSLLNVSSVACLLRLHGYFMDFLCQS